MRSAIFIVLLSVVALSAALPPNVKVITKDFKQTQEFEDIVNYLNENVSQNDIQEMLDSLPEALNQIQEQGEDEEELVAQPRSVGSSIVNAFEHIPWSKITDALKKMTKNNPKMTKVLNLVNDQKFRDLVKKAVNSHTLAEFVKDVAEHGFKWTDFLHLLLHALCSTATTIQHDQYTVGACKVLQGL